MRTSSQSTRSARNTHIHFARERANASQVVFITKSCNEKLPTLSVVHIYISIRLARVLCAHIEAESVPVIDQYHSLPRDSVLRSPHGSITEDTWGSDRLFVLRHNAYANCDPPWALAPVLTDTRLDHFGGGSHGANPTKFSCSRRCDTSIRRPVTHV